MNYRCKTPSCGWKGSEPIIEEHHPHTGLYCARCGRWIKWVGSEEIARIRRIDSRVRRSLTPQERADVVLVEQVLGPVEGLEVREG